MDEGINAPIKVEVLLFSDVGLFHLQVVLKQLQLRCWRADTPELSACEREVRAYEQLPEKKIF